jgi:7-cyano-7-deazaguanine synthase
MTTEKSGRVLLYSGGLDSFVTAHLWPAETLVYFGLGHKYEREERQTIAASEMPVVFDFRLKLGDYELPNAIIPLRNLYLVAMASHYGRTIGLGALRGEVNPDKSEQFRAQTEAVLNTCYAESYWSDGAPYRVEFPVAQWSKAELIREYLAAGFDADALTAFTRSCYAPTVLQCGHCSACIKRYIALTLNGLSESYTRNPHTSPYLETVRERWSTFSADRQQETLAVFPELEA